MNAKLDVIKHIFNNVVYGVCSGKSLVCVQGSARSGKTYNIMILLIQCCLNPEFAKKMVLAYFNTKRKEEKWDEDPAVLERKAKELQVILQKNTIDISVIRYALPSLKRSVYKDFVEIMCKMGIYDQKRMNKTEMIYTFANGSTMEFFATADNEQKIRGSKRDIAFINEGNEIGGDEFSQLRMRTSMFTIIDYNPSFTDEHWLYQLLEDVRTYRFVSTFENNPFLSDAIKDEIRSYKFTNPALWSVFGLGEFAIVDGLVFPKGTWDTCTMEEIPDDAKTSLGIDIGYSGKGDPNVATQVWTKNIGGVKHIWINVVLYEAGLNETQMVHRLRPYNDLKKYIDSANPLYIRNFEDAGAKLVFPVKKYNNSVSEGIRAMQGYKIHIVKTSVEAIKEFKNYVWQKDRHGNYTDVPIDKFNHCFTGDTLVMTQNGNVRIDEIREGDMVLTSKGYRPVLKHFRNGLKGVYQYELLVQCGQMIKVLKLKSTPTHKIKTSKGWRIIDNLQTSDLIYLCSTSEKSHTTSIKEKDIILEEQEGCMSLCGKATMGEFPKDTTYTIRTKILLTTISKILKYCKDASISRIIVERGLRILMRWQKQGKICGKQMLQHAYGISQKKEKSCIEKWRLGLGNLCNHENWNVFVVEPSILCALLAKLNSAQTSASLHGEGKSEPTIQNDIVSDAEKYLSRTNTQSGDFAKPAVLLSVKKKYIGKLQTHNLMIDEHHEYFANGLLVSNCIDSVRYVIMMDRSGRGDKKSFYSKAELGFTF